jgi:hypothetical protein
LAPHLLGLEEFVLLLRGRSLVEDAIIVHLEAVNVVNVL